MSSLQKGLFMFYCLIVGSRTFSDYEMMRKKVSFLLSKQKEITIISGGARGADSLAEQYAKEHNLPIKIFKANWSIGKSAGYKRNELMHEFISNFPDRGIIAFWDNKSRGTAHNFELAKKYNTPLKLITF